MGAWVFVVRLLLVANRDNNVSENNVSRLLNEQAPLLSTEVPQRNERPERTA